LEVRKITLFNENIFSLVKKNEYKEILTECLGGKTFYSMHIKRVTLPIDYIT